MKDERNDEINLKKIFELMLAKIWLIVALVLIGGIAAFCVTKFAMPLKYQSYTSMYVKNNTTVSEEDSVNLNDLNASKSLVSTYIAVLQDDTVMEEVGKNLVEEYGEEKVSKVFAIVEEDGVKRVSVSALNNAITMAAVDETEVLKVTAVTTDPEISAAICNIVAETAPDFLIRVVGAGSVEAIGSAKANYTPVSPSITKNTLIGILIGMFIAVAIIVIRYLFDTTIKDSNELESKYNKAILGVIHDVYDRKDGKRKSKDSDSLNYFSVLDKDTPFYVIESYKAMRTNIIFSLSMAEQKIFAVSSSNPGDGKSTTAANVAITLAQMDYRVLLIDADMRKPVQHKIFKLKNHKGFSGIISRMIKPEECINKNVVPNLDVITSGSKPPNPSELLASQNTAKVLKELSDKYDYIVVDTPPVNVVSDAMGMSSEIAGLLLVVRYGETTFEDIENAKKKLELSNMNLLGFVMNGVIGKASGGSYYNYKYKSKYGDYSYGYGSEDDKNSKAGEKK